MWVGEVKHAGGCQFHSSMQEVYNFWFHIEGEINHCGHDVVCARVGVYGWCVYVMPLVNLFTFLSYLSPPYTCIL